MRVLTNRRAVIEWAAAQHAYPVQKTDDPSQVELSKAGEAETGWRRVGWEPLFTQLDRGHRVIVVATAEAEGRSVQTDDGFEHRILPETQARAELPPEAFGPPWWKALQHEILLVHRKVKPAAA